MPSLIDPGALIGRAQPLERGGIYQRVISL